MISKKDMPEFAERRRVLLQTNEFICLLPHPHLSEIISSYNITFPTKIIMPDGFTTIPCGCATLAIEKGGKSLHVKLEGPTSKPHIAGNRVNQLEMLVTIEFRPAGLYALTGISQSELTDESISFEAVDARLCKSLVDTVERAESVGALVDGLDGLLIKNMVAEHHPRLVSALHRIIRRGGNVAVKRLSDDVYYSERQLNRIFNQHVGMGAKSFSRLIRINNAFRLLKKPGNDMTLISDIIGFHDLSHFIHDFKSVCGVTPQEYRKNMSDFYINPKKF